MKPLIPHHLVLALTFALVQPLLAAEKPQEVLDAITKLRTDRLEEAKAKGGRPDTAALQKEILAKAKAAVEGVDAAKVDLAEASAWQGLFVQAQDYRGAQTVARRWAAESKGETKFNAQLALITADARLKDYTDLRKTLLAAEPADTAGRIRVASLANSYLVNIVTNEGPKAGLQVLELGEKALPTEGFTDDRQRDLAKRTGENLAKARKTMQDNPGKEGEALEKERRASLAALLGGQRTGTNTTAAASREERDAKLAKMAGTPAADFKASQTIGEFKSVADLKGKVVMLDFFAHWCGPCIASFPSVRELNNDLKARGLAVVGVTRFQGYYKTENRTKRDMTPETELAHMKDFVKEKNMNWPLAFADKTAFDAYQCSAIPHVVLIDRTGKIRKVKVGYSADGAKAFRTEVEKLLAE